MKGELSRLAATERFERNDFDNLSVICSQCSQMPPPPCQGRQAAAAGNFEMVYLYILKLVCYSTGISTGKGMFMMRKNNMYARNNEEQEDTQTR